MELLQIIMRSRNCDEAAAKELHEKNWETVRHYKMLGFSDQYIYDLINNENEL